MKCLNLIIRIGEIYMKPIIGITPSMEVDETYYKVANANIKAILKAGGIPVVLPYFEEMSDVTQIVGEIDGLLATGGYDVDPTYFGEEPHPNLGTVIPKRDHFEKLIIEEMLKLDKPILGVCRGSQILNVTVGGDMYQDIYAQCQDRDLLQHNQKAPLSHGAHYVDVTEGSLLHQITGLETLRVNTRHHQANRVVRSPLKVSGTARDGIVEAIESKEHRFVLGLQWHPENMIAVDDEASWNIFKAFINACQKRH